MDYIKIKYYNEVVDNWGRVEASTKPEAIITALLNMTDDMFFEGIDEHGMEYCFYPEDLENKTVLVENQLVTPKSCE